MPQADLHADLQMLPVPDRSWLVCQGARARTFESARPDKEIREGDATRVRCASPPRLLASRAAPR
jgi:hypothetical protein